MLLQKQELKILRGGTEHLAALAQPGPSTIVQLLQQATILYLVFSDKSFSPFLFPEFSDTKIIISIILFLLHSFSANLPHFPIKP